MSMRDPKRIDKVMDALKSVWKKVPDWRLGQLIVNISRDAGYSDPFFMEDDRLLAVIRKWGKDNADKTEGSV